MQIKNRSLPIYIFLNCLTLGIYGFVVNMQVGDEVDAICSGDGEEPRFGYAGAVAFRAISSLVGIIVGLIVALVTGSNFSYVSAFLPSEISAATVFLNMAAFGIVFTVIGSIISGIYHKYWWYRQANRMKLNASRYGIEIKETGTDTVVFRTVLEIFLLPITIILVLLSLLIPALLIWLIMTAESSGAYVFAAILVFVFSLPIMFFGMDLTAGANFSMYFIFKNLNRYSEVVSNGAKPFDKMGYRYYPSNESGLYNFVQVKEKENDQQETVPLFEGSLYGLNGSCAGYKFDLTPNEELIIGKDASVSNIVIDPSYKEISRKHCGVTYNNNTDMFCIVDYSSNGTWAGDFKLNRGEPAIFAKGTTIKLANDKNTFRLE